MIQKSALIETALFLKAIRKFENYLFTVPESKQSEINIALIETVTAYCTLTQEEKGKIGGN